MTFEKNIQVLTQFQPQVMPVLEAIHDSDFSFQDQTLCFWERPLIALADLEPWQWPAEAKQWIVYGLDPAFVQVFEALKQLNAQTDPKTAVEQIVVFEPRPELFWALLQTVDLTALFQDPRLTLWIGEPMTLTIPFQRLITACQDPCQVAMVYSPLAQLVNQRFPDALWPLFDEQEQRFARHSPPDLVQMSAQLTTLYADMEPLMRRAYAHYPLTCHTGCSGCCENSVGFHLCVNPIEWLQMHREIEAQPKATRQQLFDRVIKTLWAHKDTLNEILFYFDAQPERMSDPQFHLELLEVARPAKFSHCNFLVEQQCTIYNGRPFTCRVFGNSQVSMTQPFTCDKDYDQMETILLDEGARSHLVASSPLRERLWALHGELNHKHVMNAWLFLHLDFESRDFLPCRVDFYQFQALVGNEARLAAHWQSLEQALDAV